MFGVEFSYHDQFESSQRVYPFVFTTRELAQAWIDAQLSSPYLKVIEIEVDPEL